MYSLILVFCVCMLTLPYVSCQIEMNSLKNMAKTFHLSSSDSNYFQHPVKRSTMLLDRLVTALQKAFKQETQEVTGMELQRRRPNGRVYWRCYFNAVSCFRRKK
uniref:Uncharacterized protein n=1 Tax=Strigamia maritima TaxID=126957 RepID=T1IPL2_STRMM